MREPRPTSRPSLTNGGGDAPGFWADNQPGFRFTPEEPGTEAFFAAVERHRYALEPHIQELVDFARFRNRDVLEVGCGIATDGIQFAQAGARYTGVDTSESALELARTRFSLESVRGTLQPASATGLPFPDQSFDLVVLARRDSSHRRPGRRDQRVPQGSSSRRSRDRDGLSPQLAQLLPQHHARATSALCGSASAWCNCPRSQGNGRSAGSPRRASTAASRPRLPLSRRSAAVSLQQHRWPWESVVKSVHSARIVELLSLFRPHHIRCSLLEPQASPWGHTARRKSGWTVASRSVRLASLCPRSEGH